MMALNSDGECLTLNSYAFGWECVRDCGLLPPVQDFCDMEDGREFEKEDWDENEKERFVRASWHPMTDISPLRRALCATRRLMVSKKSMILVMLM